MRSLAALFFLTVFATTASASVRESCEAVLVRTKTSGKLMAQMFWGKEFELPTKSDSKNQRTSKKQKSSQSQSRSKAQTEDQPNASEQAQTPAEQPAQAAGEQDSAQSEKAEDGPQGQGEGRGTNPEAAEGASLGQARPGSGGAEVGVARSSGGIFRKLFAGRKSLRPPPAMGAALVDDTAHMEQLWRSVFASVRMDGWVSSLQVIQDYLQKKRSKIGLGIEDETVLRELTESLRMLAPFGRMSLPSLIGSLDIKSESTTTVAYSYMVLRVLKTLAPYGTRFSERGYAYQRLHNTVDEILDRLPAAPLLDADAELRARLPGPFSLEVLARYPSQRSQLWQMTRLKEKIDLAQLQTYVPQASWGVAPSNSATGDENIDYTVAEDFSNYENFERGGLPAFLDAARVVNDDMLVKQWNERVKKETHFELSDVVGDEITFLLLDLSGSMDEDNALKGRARDRIVRLWLDQLGPTTDRSKIIIQTYRNRPEKPITLSSRSQMREMFYRMSGDTFFSNDSGNNAGRAFTAAVDMAVAMKAKFKKVNFRLITDGEEDFNFDMFRKAKARLGGEVELNFTAVTLATGNGKLRNFVLNSYHKNLIGKPLFVHLSQGELERILNYDYERNDADYLQLLPANYLLLRQVPNFLATRLKTIGEDI